MRLDTYAPPTLHGLTVKAARTGLKRRKLPLRALTRLPLDLPLTAGRMHFLRRVTAQGSITLRNEEWKVSRGLVGEYVWATLDLRTERLVIYHRRSEKAQAHVVKSHRYPIAERVERLKPEYRRRTKRVRVVKIL